MVSLVVAGTAAVATAIQEEGHKMDNRWTDELCFELRASGPSGLGESLFESHSQQRDRGNSGRSSRLKLKPDAVHTAAGRPKMR